jgi:outer membrane protein assembly factor BamB
MYSLDRSTGAKNWLSPVADGVHYQSTSTTDGVVWTVDSSANLDGFNAENGQPLVHRPLSADVGAPVTNDTSAGISIAEHHLFVAAGGVSYVTAPGYVIAYGAG